MAATFSDVGEAEEKETFVPDSETEDVVNVDS
jgi:hypothetical protein